MEYNLHANSLQRSHDIDQDESPNQTIRITQYELDSLIVDYYSHMNNNAQSAFSNSLATKYSQIEQEIRQVVEMRKDMQKLVEIEVLQSQHFQSMQKLILQNIESHKTIEELSNKIRQLQSKNIEDTLAFFKSRLQAVQYTPNVCLPNEILMLANQISRSCRYHPEHSLSTVQSTQFSVDNEDLNIKSEGQTELNSIIKQHNQKYELLKSIYAHRFKELSIRDQLVTERQEAFYEYSASNHELIDVLLREKEREKNLSRIQRQKFEELIKARHEIDLQNQHSNYHQNNLVSYYEIELTRLKEQMNYREKLWNAQKESLMASEIAKSQEIQKLMMTVDKISSQKEELRKELQSNNRELQKDMERTDELRNGFEQKMQSLQSQLNQNILKLSQSSRTKNELAQKLEEANKKVAEMQALRNRISDLQGQNHKNEVIKQELLRKNQMLASRGQASQSEILSLQQKIQYLQNELTQSFITSNAQIKRLNEQTQLKDDLIEGLQSERYDILRQVEQKRVLDQTRKSQLKGSEEHNRLRRQLRGQLERQSEMKQKLLDQAIERISNLLY